MSTPNELIGGIPTIHYFDLGAKGRGECLRMLFEDAGVQFVDHRIPLDAEWPSVKKGFTGIALGLPVVDLGERHFAQSIPLLRYFGKKLGKYVGQTSEDEYFLDRLSDIANDWRIHWVRTLEGVEAFNESHRSDRIPSFLSIFETFYAGSDGDFVLGAEFTYVDILVYQMIHDEGIQSLLDVSYPNLKRLSDAVERRPNIAAYLASPRRHE